MTTLTLDQASVELVSIQNAGAELHLGDLTEELTWSEQTGDMTVAVNATLQQVDNVGDGRDLWSALGGGGGMFRLDASWDGQNTVPVWEGTAWVQRLRGTGRNWIELVCYDALRTLITDEVYYIGPAGPAGEPATNWIVRALSDGGPPIGDVSKPDTVIRQYLFQGQPRAQIIDQVLRWAFYRTPSTLPSGAVNPEKVPYVLQMRLTPGIGPGNPPPIWTANTLKPGTNTQFFAFDETNCAEFGDEQSIEQLIHSVSLYSTSALVQGAAPDLEPYASALSAAFQIQHTPSVVPGQPDITQIVQTDPAYKPPANLGPLRRVLGGGGADNPLLLTQMATDLLSVYGVPWNVRTVVVPLLPMIRRGDTHFFGIKTLNDWYVVTGVVHNVARRTTTLTLDSSGVLGRRVAAQAVFGVQGDSAGGSTQPATGVIAAVLKTAQSPLVLGKPYVFGGPEGRTSMDSPAAFTSSDCSGFIGWAYYLGSSGAIDLRDGTTVSTVTLYAKTTAVDAGSAAPGDLVFWAMSQSDMSIQHVGLYLGNNQYVAEQQPGTGVAVATISAIHGYQPEYRRLAR